MRYRVIKQINIELPGTELIIPEGDILYKIPGDHLGNRKYVDYYNWNGETIELDRDTDLIEEV